MIRASMFLKLDGIMVLAFAFGVDLTVYLGHVCFGLTVDSIVFFGLFVDSIDSGA